MSTQALLDEAKLGARDIIVNDFSIHVSTINGSGSQSSNNVLLRSIFQMGVPVSGKNLFPSNIQGLPTWFTIRASKDGYLSRKRDNDFLVAMNPQTAREDVQVLKKGAAVVFEKSLGLEGVREDLFFYPIPFAELAKDVISEPRLRSLLANMIYVGVVGYLLGIDKSEIEIAIEKQFKTKLKAIELNKKAVDIGFQYAEANLHKSDPLKIERMEMTAGKILIDGNAAAALGSMFNGVTVATWYPITPSSSLVESLAGYMKTYRVDEKTGKATFAVVQAEDELAAVGMALGAGWAGARALTSTSGPGISLMSEFVGLGYFAEIPAVIWDIQRVGPSTGLPTRTSQGDILSAHLLSHGDTKHILLLPASVEECFEFGGVSFDLAERFQTPVLVLSDLDLGMNIWMSDTFRYPEKPLDRGKVLDAEGLEKMADWGRYRDIDGDGIPYRTLPGTNHPRASFFTRGSGHNDFAEYTERPEDYAKTMERLAKKFANARNVVPGPILDEGEQAEVGIIAYGTTHWAIVESRNQLLKEAELPTSYLRLRAIPFNDALKAFVKKHKRVYVVEQNRDAQMLQLIRTELAENSELVSKLRSILHFNGQPIDARSVTELLLEQEG